MSRFALPCIVCGSALENVDSDMSTNQPSEGCAFQSQGHYGCTVFDPMDGAFIEINVCDLCLKRAGEMGRVYTGRERKLVVSRIDGLRSPTVVGTTAAHRELTPWIPALSYEEDALEIEPEEVGVISGVQWAPAFAPTATS